MTLVATIKLSNNKIMATIITNINNKFIIHLLILLFLSIGILLLLCMVVLQNEHLDISDILILSMMMILYPDLKALGLL